MESLGLDEASIDVTQFMEKNGMGGDEQAKIFLGQKIRDEIH